MFYIRPITAEDRLWVKTVLANLWGSEKIVYAEKVFDASSLQGFIAEKDNRRVGLLTYNYINQHEKSFQHDKLICQIISLNALTPGQGIGSALIEGVVQEAKKQQCKKIMVITTNDNLNALKFYQKRGFVLSHLYPNAVEKSRKIKPEIPEIGEDGIPLRDELALELSIL